MSWSKRREGTRGGVDKRGAQKTIEKGLNGAEAFSIEKVNN